mgnify:CR=1 FL=1
MVRLMAGPLRLFVEHPLGEAQPVPLTREQAHYLFGVMRLTTGAQVALFNGQDGEFRAEVVEAGKRGGMLVCLDQTAPQSMPPDLWLMFAPIKKARTDFIVEKSVEMGARRIEVATVQFHGWAMKNRDALMPTREQAAEATRIVGEARAALKGTLVIDYVPADYHGDYPKRCMGGWGTTGLNVAPDGQVLPCHAAQTIPQLTFENVQDRPLGEIWRESAAFNAYRGTDWMQEPCTSCERKEAAASELTPREPRLTLVSAAELA